MYVAWLLIAVICIAGVPVYYVEGSEESNANTELINRYYEFINNDDAECVNELYGEYLKGFTLPFFDDDSNKESRCGIFNVSNVIVDSIRLVDEHIKYSNGDYTYDDISKYFVQCYMSVYRPDKYYIDGYNYFIFYLGYESGQPRICNIEIADFNSISMMIGKEEATSFCNIRNAYVYGTDSDICTYSDNPVYVDYVRNPSSIMVQGYGTMNFKDYLLGVAQAEYNSGLESTEAYRVSAMASKMFAIHKILTAASGANYDVVPNTNDQCYNNDKSPSPIAREALEYIYNYFLIDSYGAVFPTFYRSSSNKSEFCRHNGGILPQKNCGSVASDWKGILKYYYTRVDGNYYNSEMNYGDLIITYSHTHNWDSDIYCDYCGAEAY